MKAIAVFPGKPNSVHLADLPKPSVNDIAHGRGVLVKVLQVGVDGTDKEINAADYGAPPEGFDYLLIGHESLGRVEQVGGNVSELRPGDYVMATVRRPGMSVYDGIGNGQYELATSFHLPANSSWETSSECRWSYTDKDGSNDGIRKFTLTPGTDERSSIVLGASGPMIPMPSPVAEDQFLNMDPGVTIQLFNGSGANEIFDFSSNGQRLRFTRNVGTIVMDADGIAKAKSGITTMEEVFRVCAG